VLFVVEFLALVVVESLALVVVEFLALVDVAAPVLVEVFTVMRRRQNQILSINSLGENLMTMQSMHIQNLLFY
jgi:hypothetical protein